MISSYLRGASSLPSDWEVVSDSLVFLTKYIHLEKHTYKALSGFNAGWDISYWF